MLRNFKRSKRIKCIAGALLALQMLVTPVMTTSATATLLSNTIEEKTTETEQIVVSNVIPMDIETETLNEEVLREIAEQQSLNDQIEEEIRLEKLTEYINSIVCDPDDVSRTTGLHEEDYHLLTEGTWWEGNEQTLIDLEKNCGINAMFAMSVSTLESGFGTSDRAKTRNNYYGIERPTVWESLYSNTQSWGTLIKNCYVDEGRQSVWSIASKYCPPNTSYWASFNSGKMNEFYNSLITKMNDTLK